MQKHSPNGFMKKLLLPIIFLIFISCDTKHTWLEVDDVQNKAFLKKKKQLMSAIHGGWVRKDYINKLLKSNSPLQAYNKADHFLELIIDTNRTNGSDTIGNPGCLENDTEMNYFKIIFKKEIDSNKLSIPVDSTIGSDLPGTAVNSANNNQEPITTKMVPWFIEGPLREEVFELDCQIGEEDTLLVLSATHETPSNKKIIYEKVFSDPPLGDYQIDPIDYFIAQTLFKGKFSLSKSSGVLLQRGVYLTPNEKTNFKNYQMYRIGSDFGDGAPGYDNITFYLEEKEERFAWKVVAGKIYLYAVLQKGDYLTGISRKVGKLEYMLTPEQEK